MQIANISSKSTVPPVIFFSSKHQSYKTLGSKAVGVTTLLRVAQITFRVAQNF